MKTLFIFLGIALLVSCQKEPSQSIITQSSRINTTGATQIPPQSAQLQFTTDNITYQFNGNINAREYIQDGLKHIYVEVRKDSSTYSISIIGTSTEIGAGMYPYNIIPCCGGTGNTFTANSSMFIQMTNYGWDAVAYIEQDFSLQVLSYQNGYLDATFNSSRVSNGIISHLKIEQ